MEPENINKNLKKHTHTHIKKSAYALNLYNFFLRFHRFSRYYFVTIPIASAPSHIPPSFYSFSPSLFTFPLLSYGFFLRFFFRLFNFPCAPMYLSLSFFGVISGFTLPIFLFDYFTNNFFVWCFIAQYMEYGWAIIHFHFESTQKSAFQQKLCVVYLFTSAMADP